MRPLLLAALACAIGLAAAAPAAAARAGSALIKPPSRSGGSTAARIVAPVSAWSSAGGGRVLERLGPETSWSHEPQVLLALRSVRVDGREWVLLLLPGRPAGSRGWVRRDYLSLRHLDYWIELRKGRRLLLAYHAGRLVRHFRAVIGKAATPTPSGLAAVYESNRQPNPHGFLGPWALPLTALSNVLRSFGGGPGRIAIHGRDGTSFLDPLGSARSHGCIRIGNAPIRWLAAHAPPGTPVRIVGRAALRRRAGAELLTRDASAVRRRRRPSR